MEIKTIKELVEEGYGLNRDAEDIWISVNDLLNDKELMISLCDCDRHGNIHLKGCRYMEWKERITKQTEIRK